MNMSWNCTQIEERLSDYLESALAPLELEAADAHARSCAQCQPWFDARQATRWIHQLESLEVPPGLETRILAQTTVPPREESTWALLDRGWRVLWQPRFALGLAAAVFSVTMLLNALHISPGEIQARDLNPANLYRQINRQAHRLYARGTRFVNDLRLVYEIRSRLERVDTPAEEPTAPPPTSPRTGSEERRQGGSVEREQNLWLVAYASLGVG